MDTSRTPISDSGRERVYLDFYNLEEAPFAMTPDPEFLFFSDTHQNAINKLLYGINSRMGFLLLVGEVGTGKTTICRSLLDSLGDKADTVYIINPSLSGTELISSILDDLEIDYPMESSKKYLLGALNRFLLSSDKDNPVVIIIDDAQTMDIEALEDLRLLSNLETDKNKLLQILLVGQPELLDQLSRPEIRQLKQRVAITCHLAYLSRPEVNGYISRRLYVSGDKGHIRFKPDAVELIYKVSNGIPRLINRICDYTLTAGYVADSYEIRRAHVKKAVKELKDLATGEPEGIVSPAFRREKILIWMLIFFVYAGIVSAVWYHVPKMIHSADSPELNDKTDLKLYPVLMPENQSSRLGPSIDKVVAQATSPGKTDVSPQTSVENVEDPSDFFIIRVASFRTLERTHKAVESLKKKKNISSYWKIVDLGERGQWYGLYTGHFQALEEAKKYRSDNKLYDAVIERRKAN